MILVTGAAGYIGSQIVHTLHRTFEQPKIIGVDNLSAAHTCKLPPGFECFHGDVGAGAFMRNLMLREKVDQIIHCAAHVSVPESVKDPLRYYWNNTASSLALIGAAQDCAVKKFVFSSTAAVYGEPEFKRSLREDDPCRPVSPYGSSKLMVEQMLIDSGLTAVILRYFNVAGADPLGQTGPGPGGKHLLNRACEAALGGPILKVYGDGLAVRDYVHVADVATAHLGALEHGAGGCITMNIGLGEGVTVKNLIETVERVSGKHVPRQTEPQRDGDPDYIVANTVKANVLMKWQPQYTLDHMIEDTLRWQRSAA